MPVQPGHMLSHYRLVEKLGEGGMGVVWKAVDTTLDREVAIKILPEHFSQDRERLGRFEREAKLLAALNHRNIAAIYGLDESDDIRFLVMELVGGEDLGRRLARGPLPVDEAIDICHQLARALEAAHEKGVLHRDLKPANVQVTDEGRVKVLDFGLAKAFEVESAGADPSMSPTLTSVGTRAGVILGTAAYMSPEQARGKTVDRRTDIWSFGCVFYECLTGTSAFHGETVSDTLASILKTEPNWAALPERTPPRVQELVERCLEKNPRNRLHDIGDARIELERATTGREWTTSGALAAATSPTGGRPVWRAAALLAGGILIGAVAVQALRMGQDPARSGASSNLSGKSLRLSIVAPPNTVLGFPQVSPDGATIAYFAFDKEAEDRERAGKLYLRRLDHYEPVPIEGSEGVGQVTFSPDGEWVAFVAPITPGSALWRLFKVRIDGGDPPVAIGDWPENIGQPIIWLPSGDILGVTEHPQKLLRFPVDGSTPGPPVELDAGGHDASFYPLRMLPDGRHALGAAAVHGKRGFRFDVALINVETGKARILSREGTYSDWSSTGHLLFSRADTLLAAPFDLDRLELTGGPVTVAAGLQTPSFEQGAWFDLSRQGTLVYLPGGIGGTERQLMLVDRDGKVEPWSDERRAFTGWLSLSRDGARLAVGIMTAAGQFEIWISDLDRPQLRPLAKQPGMSCDAPVLSPHGNRLAYHCGDNQRGAVYLRSAEGGGEPRVLLERPSPEIGVWPVSFSPDGTSLLVGRWSWPEAKGEVLVLPLGREAADKGQPTILLADQSSPGTAEFSPDGRWIAYVSDESGRSEVYVHEFLGDRMGLPHQVSADGGDGAPRWREIPSGNGHELIYNKTGRVMSVSITTRPQIGISEPRDLGIDLVELRSLSRRLLPDGRLLVVQGEEEEEATRIHVVLDFGEEILRRTSISR